MKKAVLFVYFVRRTTQPLSVSATPTGTTSTVAQTTSAAQAECSRAPERGHDEQRPPCGRAAHDRELFYRERELQSAPIRLVGLASYAVLGLVADALGAGLAAIASSLGLGDASNHVFWYITASDRLSAYLVLFANMVLGLAVKTGFLDSLLARWRSFNLHQFTALLALGLMALHVSALLGDQYVGFSLPQLFVPFTSTYRPLPIALGIISLYALVVITVTFYVRGRIGQKAWRSIHYASFAAFFAVLIHGVYSGTDSVRPLGERDVLGIRVRRHTPDDLALPEVVPARRRRSGQNAVGASDPVVSG